MSGFTAEAPSDGGRPPEWGTVTLEMLRETFDHWRIFLADGRCWAIRPGGVAAASGPRSLIRPVVGALTPDGLAEQLCMQEHLRRMTAQELEAVWRGGFTAVSA